SERIPYRIPYRVHGFTASYNRGKYTATCNFCDRELQNTAMTRLSLHRRICDEQRGLGSAGKPYATTKMEKDIGNRHCIKIQEISGEDDNGCETEGKEIIVKVGCLELRTPKNEIQLSPSYQIQEILDSADDGNVDKTRTPVLVRSETRKSANPNQEPEQHMEFEITSLDFADDSKENYILQPSSATQIEAKPKNNLHTLKAKKMRAEIKQYHSKTQFLKTETENLKVERTLTLLRIQKLRLEIDALRA
ncbi:hypothetical protein KR054_001362, partial [Drosophila jambulina]